jgi:PAS domain-containing protein
MLHLLRHSEEADIDRILAQHSAIASDLASGLGPDAADGAASDEKQFRDLLQALPAAIYTTDASGHITFYNQACIEFAGRSPK